MKTFIVQIFAIIVLVQIIALQNGKGQQSAQIPQFTCDANFSTPLPLLPSTNSTFGGVHTPQGNLHFLVIFVGFNSDLSQTEIGIQGQNNYWAVNDNPNWANGASNDIFDCDPATIGSQLPPPKAVA